MKHDQFLEDVTKTLSAEPNLDGLFLAGSYGQSNADRFSDIDLVALADEPYHARIAALWRTTLADIFTIVFWNERGGSNMLLNAITEDWLRLDLYITTPARFVGRSQATVKPLLDRSDIYGALPKDLPPAQPNSKRVGYMIHEFIRVLGLMTVAIGRREYVTLVKGTELLRGLLRDLMLEECPLPDRGGALHLGRLLTIEQMAILEGLPYPGPKRDDLIEAQVRIAAAFFPIARRLADRLSIEWPHAFERATRRHLFNELAIELPPM